MVISRARDLFPRWICVPFRETVEGEDGTRKQPDLALIDQSYREWWVVEVELAHHDLLNHVLPQVGAFSTGRYDTRHANALHRAAPDLDRDRLVAMMAGEPPSVIVIVDSPSVAHMWRPRLREVSVSLGIVEPFRDPGNALILRLNGDQPEPLGEILTRCSRHLNLRRLWKVQSPATLLSGEDVLEIEYEGTTSMWKRIALHDAVFLQANRGDLLEGLALVNLIRRTDGRLTFQEVALTQSRRRRP